MIWCAVPDIRAWGLANTPRKRISNMQLAKKCAMQIDLCTLAACDLRVVIVRKNGDHRSEKGTCKLNADDKPLIPARRYCDALRLANCRSDCRCPVRQRALVGGGVCQKRCGETSGYSQAVVTNGGRIIWLAGADAGHYPEAFEAQVRDTFNNIQATLAQQNAKLSDIVTMTIYLKDVRYREAFGKVRREFSRKTSGQYPDHCHRLCRQPRSVGRNSGRCCREITSYQRLRRTATQFH